MYDTYIYIIYIYSAYIYTHILFGNLTHRYGKSPFHRVNHLCLWPIFSITMFTQPESNDPSHDLTSTIGP